MHTVTALEIPLREALKEELIDFWQGIFETSYDGFRPVFDAKEKDYNHDIVYLVRKGEKLGGSCHLSHSNFNPELGGLGEVATAPEFMRMGIAGTVCEAARDEFFKHGGRAIFLGTGNPEAARVYYRLGWRKLAGANMMACIASGDSPETFLVDYYRKNEPVTLGPASANERISMIPLIATPHNWQILDANAGIYSTRYVLLESCMSLYPRYEALLENSQGTWFGARSVSGILVGLSTARFLRSGQCQVDGFIHQNFNNAWGKLVKKAVDWGFSKGGSTCMATLSVEDREKKTLFEDLGFKEAGNGEPIDINGRELPTILMEISGNA
jgi:GNAT superfamily N-acetyltransferase